MQIKVHLSIINLNMKICNFLVVIRKDFLSNHKKIKLVLVNINSQLLRY